MIVVDVNVVAYLLIQGGKTDLARQVYARDRDWHLPLLWRAEFLNVLVQQMRHGGVSLEIAEHYWRSAVHLLQKGEKNADPIAILREGAEAKITAYDAQYVVLAKQLRAPCVSEDRELRRKFPQLVLSMAAFVFGTVPGAGKRIAH